MSEGKPTRKRRVRGVRPSRHPAVLRLRTQQFRERMQADGHKRMALWLSGPANDTLREIRAKTGMSFGEMLDRLLLHPDAERRVLETASQVPAEPLF